MLITILMLAAALHGGLFTGTLLYSALKSAKEDRLSSLLQQPRF